MSGLLESFERVLVLCAHTDDEFGCAGTISRLIGGGATVRYLALSRCEESVPPGFAVDVLEDECHKCTALLGIAPECVDVGPFRVRHFPAARQEILEHFVMLRRQFSPDLVLLPSSYDTHQDHATVFAEGFRAFKSSSILGYELPQNLISFENSAFVRLTEEHLRNKISALAAYRSQEFRDYASESFIRSQALVRGVQCGAGLAEAFEVIRLFA